MLYFSRWDSPESARAFAKLYADYLPKRYKKVNWIADAPTAPAGPVAVMQKPATEQGNVLLEFRGNDLVILEGFDDGVSERARDVLLGGMSLPGISGEKRQVARPHCPLGNTTAKEFFSGARITCGVMTTSSSSSMAFLSCSADA